MFIIQSIIEQLGDEMLTEIHVLSEDSGHLVFQPQLLLEAGSEQRIGPSEIFVEKFLIVVLQRLRVINDSIKWAEGLHIKTSSEGIVSIQVDYSKLI